MKHIKLFKKFEGIIDYDSDDIREFYDEMVEELESMPPPPPRNYGGGWRGGPPMGPPPGGRPMPGGMGGPPMGPPPGGIPPGGMGGPQGERRMMMPPPGPEVPFRRVVEIARKYNITVVNYDTFYRDLPELDKHTAPPRHVPAFALTDRNNNPRVVLNVPGVDQRLLDYIYHMLKHENVHVGQFTRREEANPGMETRLVSPEDKKAYFSDKDEVMAFSQSIVDMIISDGATSKRDAIRRLDRNPIYSDVKRNVSTEILQRYKKYIYLYLEKEFGDE